MSLYVLLLVMKCSIIDRSTICFDHLATPLQHTVDQSLYATFDPFWPRPSAKCSGIPPKSIVLHLLVGFPLDLARFPDCNPIENLWDNIKAESQARM